MSEIDMPAVHIPDASTVVKSLGERRLGGYLVLWGSPEQRDLEGEFFTPETHGLDQIFKIAGKIPGYYHHLMDKVFKTMPTGFVDIMQPDSKGLWVEEHMFQPEELVDLDLWVEDQMELARKYQEALRKLINEKKLFWSSGTLPGAREVAQNGHIKSWIICESTKTVVPAEFRQPAISDLSKTYATFGLDFEEVKKQCRLGEEDCADGKGAEDARQMKIGRTRLMATLQTLKD